MLTSERLGNKILKVPRELDWAGDDAESWENTEGHGGNGRVKRRETTARRITSRRCTSENAHNTHVRARAYLASHSNWGTRAPCCAVRGGERERPESPGVRELAVRRRRRRRRRKWVPEERRGRRANSGRRGGGGEG